MSSGKENQFSRPWIDQQLRDLAQSVRPIPSLAEAVLAEIYAQNLYPLPRRISNAYKIRSNVLFGLGIKIAAALALGLIGWAVFLQNSIAALSFSDIQQAFTTARWVCYQSLDENGQIKLEGWCSLENMNYALKEADGGAVFVSEASDEKWIYDPEENSITICWLGGNRYLSFQNEELFTDWMLIQNFFSTEQYDQPSEIVQTTLNDEDVWIVTFAGETDIESFQATIWCDPETYLPLRVENQQTIGEESFYYAFEIFYPEEGPVDIYDLGIPTTAQVINTIPNADVKELLTSYAAWYETIPDRYAAIFFTYSEQKNLSSVQFVYADHNMERTEWYILDQIDPNDWPWELIADGFSSDEIIQFIAGWKEKYIPLETKIYDGNYEYTINNGANESSSYIIRKQDHKQCFILSVSLFESDKILQPFGCIVPDDAYAVENQLICLEQFIPGEKIRHKRSGNMISKPDRRKVFYFDPEFHSLCVRYENYENEDGTIVYDALRFGQTGDFVYPHDVVRYTYADSDGNELVDTTRQIIHLTTDITLPSTLFFPTELPGAESPQ